MIKSDIRFKKKDIRSNPKKALSGLTLIYTRLFHPLTKKPVIWIRIGRMRIRIHKIWSMRIRIHDNKITIQIRIQGPKWLRIRPDSDPHHWKKHLTFSLLAWCWTTVSRTPYWNITKNVNIFANTKQIYTLFRLILKLSSVLVLNIRRKRVSIFAIAYTKKNVNNYITLYHHHNTVLL